MSRDQNADPDLEIQENADTDPGFPKMRIQCGSGSETLLLPPICLPQFHFLTLSFLPPPYIPFLSLFPFISGFSVEDEKPKRTAGTFLARKQVETKRCTISDRTFFSGQMDVDRSSFLNFLIHFILIEILDQKHFILNTPRIYLKQSLYVI